MAARRRGLDVLVVDKAALPARQDLRRRPHRPARCASSSSSASTSAAPRLRGGRARLCSSGPTAARSRSRSPTTAITPASCPAPSSTPRSSPARRAGVDVRDGVAVTGIERTTTASRATTPATASVAARFVVAADGHYSPVRRCLREVGAARARHMARVPPVLPRRRRPAPLGALRGGPAPGYAWVFPLRRRSRQRRLRRVATVTGPRGKQLAPAGVSCSTARACAPCSAGTPSPRRPTAPGRSRPRSSTTRLADGRVLFVGDAAQRRRPDDRRRHRPGARDRRCSRPTRSQRGEAPTTSRRSTGRRAPHARRRPAVRGRCSSACSARRSARAPRCAPRAHARGRAALRPLDVRGLPAGAAAHAAPLAPRACSLGAARTASYRGFSHTETWLRLELTNTN